MNGDIGEWHGATIHAATRAGDVGIFRNIINRGANVNMYAGAYYNGGTTMHISARYGHVDIIEYHISLSRKVHTGEGQQGPYAN
jgi:hypothetical protein